MRQISHEVFWSNVKKYVGGERYKEIKKKFEINEPDTPESIELMRNELIPIMVEAACINGCKNTESERAYQMEALESYISFVPEIAKTLADPQSTIAEKNEKLKARIYMRYTEIGEHFDKKRLCHSHPTGGYICYCDEK